MALTIADQAIATDDIDEAVARGILTAEQRDAVADLARARRRRGAVADDEQFRLVSNFNDIFVTLAILVLLFGAGGIVTAIVGGTPAVPMAWSLIIGGILVGGICWFLARYFTARRRMALPSIVLLLSFVGGMATAGAGLGKALVPDPGWGEASEFDWTNIRPPVCHAYVASSVDRRGQWQTHPPRPLPASQCITAARGQALSAAVAAILAGLFGVIAAVAHWRRYGVPITLAAGAAAAVGLLFGIVQSVAPDAKALLLWLAGAAGLIVFAAAMRFDIRDPRRETRKTDIAFWLHLLAAPLIVHPLMSGLGVFGGTPSPFTAVAVIALYLAFSAVALTIDRRALLVSALGYVLYAISALLKSGGAQALQVPLTALVIGLFLVSLSALWRQARAVVVGRLPAGWSARLPVTAH